MKKKLLALLLIITAVFTTATLVACGKTTEPAIDHIAISAYPTTVYALGQQLNLDGAQITVFYDGGKEIVVDINSSMVSTFNPSILGEQILRVAYEGASVNLLVTVVKADIERIEVTALPKKLNYVVEQNLDTTGGALKVCYVGGASEIVPITADMCSGYDMSKISTQNVKVTYKTATKTYEIVYEITVADKKLQGIEVSKLPTKAIYYVGDSELDLTDGVLFLKYDNGYPQKVNMKGLEGLTATWDNLTVNSHSVVTLTYGAKTATFTVDVKVKDIAEFKVLSPLTKRQLVGTELDLSGLKIQVTYNNYNTKEIFTFPTDKVTVEGYKNNLVSVKEPQEIALVFYSASVPLATKFYLKVYVDDKEMSGINIIRPSGSKIYQDTTISIADWQYEVVYNNGSKSTPSGLLDTMIVREPSEDVYNYSSVGAKTWHIRYLSLDVNYEFEVLALRVESLEVVGAKTPKIYYGHDIDPTGIFVKVKYNNGKYKTVNGQTEIPLTVGMVSGYNNKVLGVQTAKITFADEYESGFATDFTIFVVKKVVSSLGIKSFPKKVSYTIAEGFDYSGLVINFSYEGESESQEVSVFDADWTFSNSEWDEATKQFDTIGKKYIYLTYAGLEFPEKQGINIEINIHNNLTSISLTNENLGTVIVGSQLDFTGLAFRFTYEVGNKLVVYDNKVGEFVFDSDKSPLVGQLNLDYNNKNLTIGSRSVVVKYVENGNEVSYTTYADVVAKSPVGIEIYKKPTKLEYIHNNVNDTTLNKAGLIVNLCYNNGTKDVIDNDQLALTNYDNGILGTQQVKVTYQTFTTIFTVTVKEAVVTQMAWVGATPQINMQEGVALELSNEYLAVAQVKLTYSDGHEEIKYIRDIAVDTAIANYDKFSTGMQIPEVQYAGLSLKFTVVVNARLLTSIAVVSDSTLSAIEASNINLTDVKLQLFFDSGTTSSIIPLKQEHINKSATNPDGYDITVVTSGERTVSVTYTHNGVTCTVYVSVIINNKQMTAIRMKDMPKLKYIEGEQLDALALSTGTVIFYYNNGTTEIKNLAEASINNKTNVFNINATKFDSSEFSGFSKLQTLYVTYTAQNTEFETEFDIIMQDRKYASLELSSTNIYKFTYGELNAENVPKFTVKGYNAFENTVREYIFDKNKLLIEYVRYEERFNERDPNKDYKLLPKDAGQYCIVVSYNAGAYNDMVHNSFVNMDAVFTIEAKKIFVAIDAVTKIYGTANPNYIIHAYGTDASGKMDKNAVAFAAGDSFITVGFAGANPPTTGTLCYDTDNNAIRLFNIVTRNVSGAAIEITNLTNVGTHNLVIDGFTSANYNIFYVSAEYKITQRKVAVTPSNVTIEYGVTSYAIPYATASIAGNADSGLCNGDVLRGNPIKIDGTNAAVYAITIGDLFNSNYEIVFDGTKTVTITPKDIYVKAVSVSKVYGDVPPQFTVEFFSDITCLNKNAFAFAKDKPEGLGVLSFTGANITYKTVVGNYIFTPTITPYTEGTVPEGVLNVRGNYVVHYIEGAISITPRSVLITANSQNKVFGESDLPFTYTAEKSNGTTSSGLIVIDAIGTYDTLKGTLTRTSGEYAGSYAILMGSLQAENSNYAIKYSGAFLTIAPVVLVVKFDAPSLEKIYDGKLPSIPKEQFHVFKVKDGQETAVTDAAISAILHVEFRNPSKNIGSYSMSISSSDISYTVNFPINTTYNYSINTRSVNIEYIDLPDNLEYKRDEFLFYAKVLDSDLQNEYNLDGSVKLDANNNPIKDKIDIVLSLNKVVDAGIYKTYPIKISSANYELTTEAKKEKTFTIKQRALVVKIITNAGDGITLQKEYSAQNAYVLPKEYVVENKIPNVDVLITLKVLNPIEGDNTTPKNVRYDDSGNVIGYDIVALPIADNNYTLTVAKAYKYKILPKTAEVMIVGSSLEKTYDNMEPQLGAGSVMVSAATLLTSALNFKFERRVSDGRSNSDVGTYSISVTSGDKNHNVILAKAYDYIIKPIAVSVTFGNNFNKKQYDSQPIFVPSDAISYTNAPGKKPFVRTFVNATLYNAYVASIKDLLSKFSTLQTAANRVEFVAVELTKLSCNDVLTALNAFNNSFGAIDATFSKSNQGILNAEIAKIDNKIRSILALVGTEADYLIQAGNAKAEVLASLANIYDSADAENTYLAFVIDGNTDGTAVGHYTYTMNSSDFNKRYELLNISRSYVIEQRSVAIKITGLKDGAESAYGDIIDPVNGDRAPNPIRPPQLGYEFYDEGSFLGTKLELPDLKVQLTIEFGDTVSASNPYHHAGKYKINTTITEGNVNYSVNYVQEWYTIAKKHIEIKISDTIGAGENGFHYGDFISETQLRQWSFVGGAGVLVGDDGIDKIKTDAAQYECYYYPDGVKTSILGVKVPAGAYPVTINAENGFNADDYEFSYIEGLVTVQKKALEVQTNNGVLYREYGREVEFEYTGFVAGEDLSYVVAQDGAIISPIKDISSLDGAIAFAATTDAGNAKYKVKFSATSQSLTNYYIKLSDSYTLSVKQVALTLIIEGVGANGETLDTLTAVYGSAPRYKVHFDGFLNNDERLFNTFFDVANSEYTKVVSFNFKRDVRNKAMFGTVAGNLVDEGGNWVVKYGEFAFLPLAKNEHIVNGKNTNPLRNYIFNAPTRVKDVEYTVTPKAISAGLNKDIAILYSNGNAIVEPYLGKEQLPAEGVSDKATFTLKYGQYGPQNIVFSNDFAYRERAEDVFAKKQDEGIVSRITGYDKDGKPITEEFTYFKNREFFVHQLKYDKTPGVKKLKLEGLVFAGIRETEAPNYIVNYSESNLTIYSIVNSIEAASDSIILEGDATSVDNLEVYALNAAGTKVPYTLANNGGVITYTSEGTPAVDSNSMLNVEYNNTYKLTPFNETDMGDVSDYIVVTSEFDSSRNVTNNGIKTKVPVRIYQKDTVVYNNVKPLPDGQKGVQIDATGVTQERKSNNLSCFDVIKTSVRFDAQKTNRINSAFSYEIIINGDAAFANGISLLATGGYYRVGNDKDGYSIKSVYSLAIVQYKTVNADVKKQVNELAIDQINLFDGYTHDIVIYYEKRLNTVYVSIDGIINAICPLTNEDITNEQGGTIYGYKCSEQSPAGFTLKGISMWAQNFNVAKQGYKDNFATLARPTVGLNEPSVSFIQYINSNFGVASVDVAKMFEPYLIKNKALIYKYFIDGNLAFTRTSEANSSQPIKFKQGIHNVSLVIYKGSEEISRSDNRLLVTTAAKDVSVYKKNGASEQLVENMINGKGVDIFGYARAGDATNTADAEDLNVIGDGSNNYKYPIRQVGLLNYTQTSLSFSVTKANFAGDYDLGASYINLYDSTVSDGDLVIRIKMPYVYTAAGVDGYTTSSLEVKTGGVIYTTPIDQINWDNGSVYTAELYLGKAKGPESGANSVGEASFRVRLFEGAKALFDSTITTDSVFDGANKNIPYNKIVTINDNPSNYYASITAQNARFTIFKAEFNGGKALDYDYINLADGSFVQKAHDGSAYVMPYNGAVTLANSNSATRLDTYSHIAYQFSASMPNVNTIGNIKFILTTTNTTLNNGRGSMLEFTKTPKLIGSGYDTKLNFVFFDGVTAYKAQRLSNTIDLTDGNQHYIKAIINRKPIEMREPIAGINAFSSRAQYQYITVDVFVDNVEIGAAIMPFANNMNYWYKQDDTYGQGALAALDGSTFLPRYNFVEIVTNANVAVALKNMQTGFSFV